MIGLSQKLPNIAVRQAGRTKAVPKGASAFLDFQDGFYWVQNRQYTEPNIPGRSFTRSGARAADRADGSQTIFPTGVPRITDLGLRVTAGATNLLTYSQDFSNAAWAKVSAGTGVDPVVTANAAEAPDGTMTADLVVFDRGAGNLVGDRSELFQTISVSSGAHTQTQWVKAATPADVGKELGLRNVGASSYGVITLTADWQRFPRTETGSGGTVVVSSRGTVTADNQVSAHLWGAQLNTGAAADYIPTEASAASAGADEYTLTGAFASGDAVFLEHDGGTAESTWGVIESGGEWDFATAFDGWGGSGFIKRVWIIPA